MWKNAKKRTIRTESIEFTVLPLFHLCFLENKKKGANQLYCRLSLKFSFHSFLHWLYLMLGFGRNVMLMTMAFSLLYWSGEPLFITSISSTNFNIKQWPFLLLAYFLIAHFNYIETMSVYKFDIRWVSVLHRHRNSVCVCVIV